MFDTQCRLNVVNRSIITCIALPFVNCVAVSAAGCCVRNCFFCVISDNVNYYSLYFSICSGVFYLHALRVHTSILTEMATTKLLRNCSSVYQINALYFGRQTRLMLKLASGRRNNNIALSLTCRYYFISY